MATSAAAAGKINVATARGEQVPSGWLIDKDGKPSTDPRVLRQGGALLPLGGAEGYKGYGLAAIVEIFSGLLTGLGFGVEPTGRHNDGCFIAVFNVAAFRDLETFKREVTEFAQYLKATPPAEGFTEVFYPGEIEYPARTGPAEERHSGRGRNLEQAARPGAGLRDRGRVGTIGKLTHGRNDTCQWIARHGRGANDRAGVLPLTVPLSFRGQSLRRLEDTRFLTGGAATSRMSTCQARPGCRSCARRTRTRRSMAWTPRWRGRCPACSACSLRRTCAAWPAAVHRAGGERGADDRAATPGAGGRTGARHVGDPVAFVVAETRTAARDAAEAVNVDYRMLPVRGRCGSSIAPTAPQLWAAGARQPVVPLPEGRRRLRSPLRCGTRRMSVELELVNNRIVISATETRGAIGQHDAGGFHLMFSGAGVHALRSQLADSVFRVPRAQMRVSCPDVGGGFGVKNALYPEWVMLLWAARHSGRPVKWIGERSEDFVTTAQGRDNVTRARLALDARGSLPGTGRRHNCQSRRVSFVRRSRQFHQCAGQRHGQRLCHSGDLHGRAGGVHQHRADRRLSRRRQARSELHDRAADRRGRPPPRLRSDRPAPAQPGARISLPQGARHGDRLRPFRRQHGRCDRCRRP